MKHGTNKVGNATKTVKKNNRRREKKKRKGAREHADASQDGWNNEQETT